MKMKTRPLRWWDLPAALLLLSALATSATRLVATNWTSDLNIVQFLAVFGAILGFALGQSRFSPRVAGFLAIAYGSFAIPYQLGLTIQGDVYWAERLIILVNRLGIILYQLVNRETVYDSLLFLVLMSILYWGLAVHAGYTLVRYGNAWQAVLPAGLTLFIIHSFDPYVSTRAWYLAIYLFFALVIIARLAFLHQHNRWQKSRTALPPHLGLDFIRFTMMATLVIVLFAWTVPALAGALPAAERAWQPVRRAWKDTRDRFENIFASLRSSVVPVGNTYGMSAFLGKGTPLSDQHMFNVRTPPDMPPSIRLYWRARTYDTYENGQWLSTNGQNRPYNPESDELPVPSEQGRWLGSFEFISAANINTLFTPAQPLWVDRPSQVEYVENPDGTVDISSFRASPSLQPGQEYKVQASINHATVAQLQTAGVEYPEWITERYLGVPDSITPRTRQLAEEITAGLETPYDKTTAITSYLRENITYVEFIDQEIPTNQEIIDWFLFDLKQGFCNYYSSAEIILLRSLGIPTRWSVGYAQGERTAEEGNIPMGTRFEENIFIVRQRDAHAWPEVYFPGIGWVEFEPTASQPMIFRLPGDDEVDSLIDPGITDEDRLRQEMEDEMDLLRQERGLAEDAGFEQSRTNVVYWLFIIGVPLAGGMVLLIMLYRSHLSFSSAPLILERTLMKIGIRPPKRVRLWARRASLPPLTKAYIEINNALNRLGEGPNRTDTPAERASVLGKVVPPANKPAQLLVHEYHIGAFSQEEPNLAIALRAASDIRIQSFKAFMERILMRFQQPSRAKSKR